MIVVKLLISSDADDEGMFVTSSKENDAMFLRFPFSLNVTVSESFIDIAINEFTGKADNTSPLSTIIVFPLLSIVNIILTTFFIINITRLLSIERYLLLGMHWCQVSLIYPWWLGYMLWMKDFCIH